MERKIFVGIYGASLAYFLTQFPEEQILVVLPTEDDATLLTSDINTFLNQQCKQKEAILFPNLEKIGDLPVSREILGERLKIFIGLAKNKNIIVTVSRKAIEESLHEIKNPIKNLIILKVGDVLNISEFTNIIIKSGYEREYLVENKGKWSIRGGIIDVYPIESECPVRIELEADRISSIRLFDPLTQRTEKILTSFEIFLECLDENNKVLGLPDYFKDKIIVVHEQTDFKPAWITEMSKIIYTSPLDTGENKYEKIKFNVRSTTHIRTDLNLLKKEVKSLVEEGFEVIFFSSNEGEKSRLIEIFNDIGIFDEIKDSNKIKFEIGNLSSGFIWKDMNGGLAIFSDNEIFSRYATRVKRIKGTAPIFRKKNGTVPMRLSDLIDIKTGDYVVHSDYGIGRFLGISRIEVDGSLRDFLTIEYGAATEAGATPGFSECQVGAADKLYVPFSRLNVVSKYIGDKEPVIDSLFSNRWTRTKEFVKEKAKKIAKELIELYAAREVLDGFAFSNDTHWQKELEDSFIYEETEDQLKAINEVKLDMESTKPMDRLICGDVGYGKTEVAMRSAFKAIMDKKQVAVLAPTTILVEQHYRTFKERMADYPINIDMLSRFRTKREQKKVLENMQKGLVDIVIGTHRLLQKDIKFYDLGLVVVDEEQRFGVNAKETLKQIKKTIDVLTLTATPIPRTLHIALSGIKKISVINTPPEGRIPIETYCFFYNEKTIKEAIEIELSRAGQVFYLYNRIEDISEKKEKLKNLLGTIKIAIAHGKMNSFELEEIMRKFTNREYDILLSTTIIENGLDMPNVNTIIIENAHTFGLSELYQLRGRVGRGLRKAYAYVTYPENAALSLSAIERLKAIEESSELGGGFKIALKDLEIRGAGNIIGVEQHGYIAKIGFDLYTQLLSEAIKEETKQSDVESERKEPEPEISIKIDAYIPDSYINNDIQKINAYRKIASISDELELNEFKEEMIDIYGKMPVEVENLFSLIEIKIIAIKKKVKLIKENQENILIEIMSGRKLNIQKHENMINREKLSVIVNALKSRNL